MSCLNLRNKVCFLLIRSVPFSALKKWYLLWWAWFYLEMRFCGSCLLFVWDLGGDLFVSVLFFSHSWDSHFESVSGTKVLSLNEKCMQESLPIWNFNEFGGSNVMRFCQMWTEITDRILKEALRSTYFSVSIWKQPEVCDLWRHWRVTWRNTLIFPD